MTEPVQTGAIRSHSPGIRSGSTRRHTPNTIPENSWQDGNQNQALTIDGKKGVFHLAALKAADKADAVGILKCLIESRLFKIRSEHTIVPIFQCSA
jgi:hypothetical protein